MALLRQRLLILFALILSGGQLFAASREQKDFGVAAAAFKDGMWSRAEVEFAQFIEKHPDSELVPQAALMQGQADFKQGKLLDTVAVLQARESSAGTLSDQYAYWIGLAQFQNGDYAKAADTFAGLVSSYPDSQWRLDAIVNEASAYSKLSEWAQAVALLQSSDFQQEVKTNATDVRVLNGRLLLAQSLLAEHNPASAEEVLQSADPFKHDSELDWRRLYLLCQARLAAGDTNGALALTSNLIAIANSPDLRAQGVAEQANVLEKIGRLSDALAVYQQNLTNGAPADWQRQAIMKTADLSAAQTNFSAAEDSLQDYRSRFPDSAGADSALLALGELRLKSYVASPSAAPDDLRWAQSYFDEFVNTYTNSPLLGKAFLDRGWCDWILGKWPESASNFQAAAESLPVSVDLAVARFKLGDAQFRLSQFSDARENYQAVVNDFTNFPVVNKDLGAQALYQTLRVCLQLNDIPGMSNAMAQILKIYPMNNVAEKGILLVGQGLSDLGQPPHARELFQKFEKIYPESTLLPDVELGIARTYEQEGNWPMAIAIYDSWIGHYANNPVVKPAERAAVKYARAWANYQGGDETNAFLLFTNFITEFPSNADLTPVSLWWLGDYYSGHGDWANAEKNYELVFQYNPPSKLTYPAMLMAARAAMGRQGYGDATNYLLNIMGETNCPPEMDLMDWNALYVQAWFAYGDVLMQTPSSDTNDPYANFKQAILYFQYVWSQYPGSEQAALALGETGDCYYQLASQSPQYYGNATNAYAQVIATPAAGIAPRSQAQLGIGMVDEKLAALTSGMDQTALLQAALDNYLDVFFGNNLRDGETADPFWVKKAGLQALPLVESLGTGDPNKFIDQMETVLPQLKDSLEKKRLDIPRPKTSERDFYTKKAANL